VESSRFTHTRRSQKRIEGLNPEPCMQEVSREDLKRELKAPAAGIQAAETEPCLEDLKRELKVSRQPQLG
jgi:hypothetical protein